MRSSLGQYSFVSPFFIFLCCFQILCVNCVQHMQYYYLVSHFILYWLEIPAWQRKLLVHYVSWKEKRKTGNRLYCIGYLSGQSCGFAYYSSFCSWQCFGRQANVVEKQSTKNFWKMVGEAEDEKKKFCMTA